MSLRLTKKSQSGRKIINIIAWLILLGGLSLMVIYLYWLNTGIELVPVPQMFQSVPIEDIVEKDITPEEVKTHTVPANHPRYLTISNLGVNKARVISVGLEPGTKQIATPAGIFDAGWFNESGLQSTDETVIFIDGHNGGPTKDGIFKHLPDLGNGSEIFLERGDGLTSRYKVVENYSLPLSEYTADKIKQIMTPINQQETLALMSCSGNWIPARKTYSDRVVVKALLVSTVDQP